MASAVALSMLVWTGSASAASLQWATIDGNDCSGFFGQGFEDCSAYGSPIVIKFNENGSVSEVNSIFPSITGNEFVFNPSLAGNLSSGEFTYNPGANDPAIKYWVAKGGSEFNVFWWGDADPLSAVAITPGDAYEWFTPINPNNEQGYGLSHLSFYDTANGGGGGDSQVPEPASLILFGLGTLAAGYRARRRFTA